MHSKFETNKNIYMFMDIKAIQVCTVIHIYVPNHTIYGAWLDAMFFDKYKYKYIFYLTRKDKYKHKYQQFEEISANNNMNIFGLTKKGKYKCECEYLD